MLRNNSHESKLWPAVSDLHGCSSRTATQVFISRYPSLALPAKSMRHQRVARKREALPRIELGFPDSESEVIRPLHQTMAKALTATLQRHTPGHRAHFRTSMTRHMTYHGRVHCQSCSELAYYSSCPAPVWALQGRSCAAHQRTGAPHSRPASGVSGHIHVHIQPPMPMLLAVTISQRALQGRCQCCC